ncbi:hypothetical protein [Maribacter forsetii]|uniref:hypothetical protein n=1 Tax=Maribacter forsetii TaxID=444515 RepID=UPI0005624BB3|nr:hypothetical protein [Maribacter forsetii]
MEEQKLKVTELEKDLVDAINEKEQECNELFVTTKPETPKEKVQWIREYVDKLLLKEHSEEDLREYALKLGALWGKMVVEEYNWKWKYIDFGNDVEGIYIVSPKNYYCCPPLFFLTKILLNENEGFDGSNDNTVMLLFNMMNGIENKKPKKNYQILT